jgi:hypothetical protein
MDQSAARGLVERRVPLITLERANKSFGHLRVRQQMPPVSVPGSVEQENPGRPPTLPSSAGNGLVCPGHEPSTIEHEHWTDSRDRKRTAAKMKIDFELLEKMVEAGASGSVIVAYLKDQHAKGEKRRDADNLRKRSGNLRKSGGNVKVSASFRKHSAQIPLTDEQWEETLSAYKKYGLWSKYAGPEPESPACRCPRELLAKFDIQFATEGVA